MDPAPVPDLVPEEPLPPSLECVDGASPETVARAFEQALPDASDRRFDPKLPADLAWFNKNVRNRIGMLVLEMAKRRVEVGEGARRTGATVTLVKSKLADLETAMETLDRNQDRLIERRK